MPRLGEAFLISAMIRTPSAAALPRGDVIAALSRHCAS
jgi:hypothetical protein